jgi:hypothetical protein
VARKTRELGAIASAQNIAPRKRATIQSDLITHWRAFMAQRQQHVFVLEIADGPALAFPAENVVAAEALIQVPWFARAVGDFCCVKGCKTWDRDGFPLCARAASQAEASLYWGRIAEFAEEAGQLLLAHISAPG